MARPARRTAARTATGRLRRRRRRARRTAGSRSSTSATPGISRSRARTGAPARLQRRDLQLPRAPRRARGEGPPLPQRDRHRGRPRRLPRVGRALRRALQRHVGVRDLGRAATQRLFCSRDRFGVKPFYYRYARRPARVRERAEGVPRRPARPARGRTERSCATISSTAGSTTPTRRSSRASASCRRRTRSCSTRDGLRIARYWQLEPARPAARATRSKPCASSSSTRCGCGCAATSPVGTCLSGGLDSSADRRASLDLLLRNEAENARAVGERAADVHRVLRRPGLRRAPVRARRSSSGRGRRRTGSPSTPDDLVDDLDAIVEAQDEPFGSTSICAAGT